MPPALLEMESAETAAAVGEASLPRAELDSKVQRRAGAAGELSKPSFIPFLFLAVLRKEVDARAISGVGAAPSAPALVNLFVG